MRGTKKLLFGGTCGLAAVMVLSGTFAWFSATNSVTNHLETSRLYDDDIRIVEKFDRPEDWQPGQAVVKEVAVANASQIDAFVRVSFEEVLGLLNGPATGRDHPRTGAEVAQVVNIKAFAGAEWKTPTQVGLIVNGAPADVEIRLRDSGNGKYSVAAWLPTKDGQGNPVNQKVTMDPTITTTTVANDTLQMSNVTYWAFDGLTETKAAWANFVASVTGAPVTIVQPDAIGWAQTDLQKKITIEYDDPSGLITPTPTAGKWWYNANDGFFYYIGLTTPGTTTPNLMKSLTLAADAGNEYAGMSFDLIVNMEALQATSDALTAATGWNLKADTDQALLAALIAAIPPTA
jgi:predicted ribosomally synthesized peptide with SipW-like signal peptide